MCFIMVYLRLGRHKMMIVVNICRWNAHITLPLIGIIQNGKIMNCLFVGNKNYRLLGT